MDSKSGSWFLENLLGSLRTTIGSLETESLLKLHQLLDWEEGPEAGGIDAEPSNPEWHRTVDLVEREFRRRGVVVRLIRRQGEGSSVREPRPRETDSQRNGCLGTSVTPTEAAEGLGSR
jgi:hypothetical protein